MAKVKIISNPYQRSISYQNWDGMGWRDVNERSNLLKDKYVKGFFPFHVREILDIILRDYQAPGEKVHIVFQGTEDEYNELLDLCKDGDYAEAVSLEKSNIFLENARDIFPEINEVFHEKIQPFVMQTGNVYEKTKDDIEKYTDVSNDIIPVCVMGNYSSGKSSFINALIGSEILPSGAEPVTAKIYKIRQSPYEDRGSVSLKYKDQGIRVRFDGNSYRFSMATEENELSKSIAEALNGLGESTMTALMNKTLEIINQFDTEMGHEAISDTIEIEVPFVAGLWGESKRQFIIFDTPGSNSASNKSHSQLLKEALKGFSNGLPLYLSEFDKLDSTDNESLYRKIEQLEELDDRFTMVVVNKADAAELDKGGFTKDKENRILGETIPKHLYKSGIFFVSSVIGLGAKNEGAFFDDHYAELFEEKRSKFSDKNSRFYKTLYRYNIMPKQLKEKAMEMAENSDDLLWANSGMLTIERGIQTFAIQYSSYNKCKQAKALLDRIMDTTNSEIAITKREREKRTELLRESHESDKRELIEEIETGKDSAKCDYTNEYQEHMCALDDEARKEFSADSLKKLEAVIEKNKQEEHHLADRESDAKSSFEAIGENFLSNVGNIFSGSDPVESFKKVGTDLVTDIKHRNEKSRALGDARKQIDKATADNVLNAVSDELNARLADARRLMDDRSKAFWGEKTQQFKESLIGIVSGTSVLDVDKRKELENIIIAFGEISFEYHAEEILWNRNFKQGVKIFDFEIIRFDRLNIDEIAKACNEELRQNIPAVREAVQNSHTDSFVSWQDALVETVKENIVAYSPILHSQEQIIKEETERIGELEEQQKRLASWSEAIRKMMDWKEA